MKMNDNDSDFHRQGRRCNYKHGSIRKKSHSGGCRRQQIQRMSFQSLISFSMTAILCLWSVNSVGLLRGTTVLAIKEHDDSSSSSSTTTHSKEATSDTNGSVEQSSSSSSNKKKKNSSSSQTFTSEWKRVTKVDFSDLNLAVQDDPDTQDDNQDTEHVKVEDDNEHKNKMDATLAAKKVVDRIVGTSLESRISKVFERATSQECRAKIAEHFGYFVNAFGMEVSLPFEDNTFVNECTEEKYDLQNLPKGMHFGHIQNRVYQPPRNESTAEEAYIDDPNNLILCYGILTHDDPSSTIRLIETLYEENYVFVVHVDAKESANETQQVISEYAQTRPHVHVIEHPYRVRVNWGGFSMVNATLQMLKYAFNVDQQHNHQPLEFHKFVHLASTSYPIASNTKIRHKIASYPLDANMMNIIMKPTDPNRHVWHYFVECDDWVHRIYRLKPLTSENGGIDMYTSSQWFIISRDYAQYLAEARPGTFVHQYLEYVEHVVVADETFFGTVLRNTEFCHKHHNQNFLRLQFDRWESDIDASLRDARKCIMKDPNHCGRSPTTMTMDYMDILELSDDLFARKFTDSVDATIKDVIDFRRQKEEEKLQKLNQSDILEHEETPSFDHSFDGHGVLIVAKETVSDPMPLCLGLGDVKNYVRLVPCFHDWVPPTLAPDWETGAVIVEETKLHNRWELGPCSSDGSIKKLESGVMNMTPGMYSPVGPRCMLKQMDGIRHGRCIDGESESTDHGSNIQVFPCVRNWNQFISFGNGTLAPRGSLHLTIPTYMMKILEREGKTQGSTLCLGVKCRGIDDDADDCDEAGEDEDEVETEINDNEQDATTERVMKESSMEDSTNADESDNETDEDHVSKDDGVSPLKNWVGEQVVTTSCSNTGAVLQFVFVPYIEEDIEVEEEDDDEGESDSNETEVDPEL